MIKKHASANWKGSLTEGTGTISTESGVLDAANYGFKKRFEGEPGSNPEELIGAAHAACFSMALSMILGQGDMEAADISTKSTISMDKEGEGFAIKTAHLDVTIDLPGGDKAAVLEAAETAKANCPVSKLLNCEITMEARVA
ncbi:OsmC family protein [Mesobacterium pallidum]|uniref:OsmC family protein n=1 Tax=Mesobacterium pallidum TaxID=2872037 RepID=UPI001EE2C340|nr:OsmC family protein [Mesobacterium pallidum]